MKIKILMTIPVRGCQLGAGDICEVIRVEPSRYRVRNSGGYWVMTPVGEVKILKNECEEENQK